MSPLSAVEPRHLVDAFDCGEDELTDWLKRFARASDRAGSARVFVVHRDLRIVGYLALAAGSGLASNAPDRLRRGLAGHPVPVVLLARLGVDLGEQGKGVGKLLLWEALMRVAQAADLVGVGALLIQAKNENARGWYQAQVDFEQSLVDPLQLMLLMKDLRKALAAS